MHSLLQYPFDPNAILQKRRRIRRALLSQERPRITQRIAVLGGSTTHDVIEILELFLLDCGVKPLFYESEFGKFYEDACFGDLLIEGQRPDIVFFHTGRRNITAFPRMKDTDRSAELLLDAEFARFQTAWEKIADRYGAVIIQNNFELPDHRLLGNLDATDARGQVSFLRRMNERFAAYARTHPNFYINDIAYLSACYGLDRWSDSQAWYLYKYQLAIPAIPYLAQSVAHIAASLLGQRKKALALDLDNTLWGGVVGDDGEAGLEIGHETPVGQSYSAFQEYVLRLKETGVLLAVNSKNDLENAISGLDHPEGTLRPDDFSVICANWRNKDENLLEIAQTLNILPNSIVFFDDNPAERALVSAQLPEVSVPEPGAAEDYIRALDRGGYFEATRLSADDLKRSEMMQENAARQKAQASFSDYGQYLRALEMHAVIRPFDEIYLPRITQLTNKSNQFNLTTRRYQQTELTMIARDGGRITRYGKLTDRFGDNGVVSVLIGRIENETLHIELWLMSCRVLKRGMECAMLDELARACRTRGLRQIAGYYFPTEKNGMVRSFYGEMGFDKVKEAPDGASVWRLDLSGYENRNQYIKISNEVEDV